MVRKLEKNIFFHISSMKKVSLLSLKIIADLKKQELEKAVTKIESRNSLIEIIIQLGRKIEEQIKEELRISKANLEFFKAWGKDTKKFSNEQSSMSDEIAHLLTIEKEKTTIEIASIFDKKSRHKGYDLTTVK